MRSLFIFLVLFLPFGLRGQLDSIRKVERELINATGAERITKRLTLSKLHFQIGNYREASGLAESAFKMAEYDSEIYLMALALNYSGQVAMAENNYRKARKDLWESVKLIEQTNYTDLLLEDLTALQRIARVTLRKKELNEVEQLIAAVRNRESDPGKAGIGATAEQQPNPSDLLGALEATTRQLSQELNSLNSENEALERSLEIRKREIEAMSQQQMQQELELALQQNLLDSLSLHRLRDSLLLTQQDMLLQDQFAQLELQRSQRNLFLALGALGAVLAIGLFFRYRSMRKFNHTLKGKNDIILEEQRRSEELLLNILPATVAEELKTGGAAKTRHYNQVSVLFADFKEFSKIANKLSPENLVAELDFCFKNFDRIIEKYHLEKIKTIGDAYMCAGGLPRPDAGHPVNIVMAAIEMQRFLREWKLQKAERGEPFFEARLGIHTGPIVAGVVGSKKFAYDIWGDTVNVAARMESSGEAGRINISATTYQLVKDEFPCKYRGKVPAKNFGEIDMYFVDEEAG